MSLARRLSAVLVAAGLVLFVVGVVLGLRPVTVQLVTVSGDGPDLAFDCGTHFAPSSQPFELRPGSDTVQVGPDAFMPVDAVERQCGATIGRAWLFLPWLLAGLGAAGLVAGLVLLASRQAAGRPAG